MEMRVGHEAFITRPPVQETPYNFYTVLFDLLNQAKRYLDLTFRELVLEPTVLAITFLRLYWKVTKQIFEQTCLIHISSRASLWTPNSKSKPMRVGLNDAIWKRRHRLTTWIFLMDSRRRRTSTASTARQGGAM